MAIFPQWMVTHDDAIKWKYFPRYWPFVRGIHRSPVNSPHKGQWRGALMFSLICAWIHGWINNRKAGDLKRHRAHYDVTVMVYLQSYGYSDVRNQTSTTMILIYFAPDYFSFGTRRVNLFITLNTYFVQVSTPLVNLPRIPRRRLHTSVAAQANFMIIDAY